MGLPRPPDWLIYAAVVAALLTVAISQQQRAEAPPAPAAAPKDGQLLRPASPLDPAVVVEVPDPPGPSAGTAFSVASSGIWVTARHVVDGCRQAAIVVGEQQGVAAELRLDTRGEAAILLTEGGAPALPLDLTAPLRRGAPAYHPGFPQGQPGEAASRLIGRENLVVRGRGARTEPVLAWAETGRTEGLTGTLAGLSGAPALDARGRVIGVTIAEAPRRGRIYTTTPAAVRRLLDGERRPLPAPIAATPLTPGNYARVAEGLRRDLRVAQVVCLAT